MTSPDRTLSCDITWGDFRPLQGHTAYAPFNITPESGGSPCTRRVLSPPIRAISSCDITCDRHRVTMCDRSYRGAVTRSHGQPGRVR